MRRGGSVSPEWRSVIPNIGDRHERGGAEELCMTNRRRSTIVVFVVLSFAFLVPLSAQGRPPDKYPVNVSAPTISGTPAVGSTLTTSDGSWTGSGITLGYQWYTCPAGGCNAISGATASTYTPTAADGGHSVLAVVTATNHFGSATASSQSVGVPVPVSAPSMVTAPSITGTPKSGLTLSTSTGTWNYGPTSYAYQWLRCNSTGGSCATSPTQTGAATYALTLADVGSTIRVAVTASNAGGSASSTSAATAVVAAAPAAPAPAPTVSITSPSNGQTVSGSVAFTASVSGATPARVELSVDSGTPYVDTASPYTSTLNTTTLANGTHTLTAKAVMSDGTSVSANVTVNVQNAASPPPPPPAPTPSSSLPAGNAWVADGLANLEIGKTAGRQVAIRFRADEDGTVSSARVYLIFRALGYYAGNGGYVHCELQADAGGAPSGVALAGATITDPMASGPFRTFTLGGHVTSGQLYYLVFTNTAADPIDNYVSLDDLYDASGEAEPDKDLAVLWKYDGSTAWSVNTHHTPIVQISYGDGSTQGQGYVDALSSSGLVNVQGGTTAQVAFTPSVSKSVTSVVLRVKKSGAPGPLSVTLGGVTATVPASAVSTSYSWVKVPLSAFLLAGQGQTLTVSAPAGDSYQMFPYQKGAAYGLTAGVFSDGHYVSGSRTDLDLPIYLTP